MKDTDRAFRINDGSLIPVSLNRQFAEIEGMIMAATHTMTDLASELGITPREARKWHRKNVTEKGGVIGKDTPGKGKRYALDGREFARLKALYLRQQAEAKASETKAENAS